MDAPLCRLCEKRHYGSCADAVVPPELRARKPAKKPVFDRSVVKPVQDSVGNEELIARVESLEARVLELESRKKYMRDYQRARRAEEKADV